MTGWLETERNGWKLNEMAKDDWIWLECLGLTEMFSKRLEIARN